MPLSKSALSRNLAISLAHSDWSGRGLEEALRRRLPQRLRRLAGPLAADLLEKAPQFHAPAPKTVARMLMDCTDFNKIVRFCVRNDIWPQADLNSPLFTPTAPFARLDVPQLSTLEDLAEWLVLPLDRLDYLADPASRYERHGDFAVNHYRYQLIGKRNGGVRLLEAPKANLKGVQRKILTEILGAMPVHDDAFGFVKGRNCLVAAQRHVGEQVVVSFDIGRFFPSVNAGRVYGLFRCLGYPHNVARHLCALCTNVVPTRVLNKLPDTERALYRVPHLPQGAPTSPALANQMAFAMDRRLSGLARCLGANYSRYADDFTFSGGETIERTLLRAVPAIVEEEGFALNPAKTRVMQRSDPQTVTGVVVNAHLNVDRASFDRIKAVIHACGKADDSRLMDARFRASLLGQIGWVESVNPPRGVKLRQLLEQAWLRRFAEAADRPPK